MGATKALLSSSAAVGGGSGAVMVYGWLLFSGPQLARVVDTSARRAVATVGAPGVDALLGRALDSGRTAMNKASIQ